MELRNKKFTSFIDLNKKKAPTGTPQQKNNNTKNTKATQNQTKTAPAKTTQTKRKAVPAKTTQTKKKAVPAKTTQNKKQKRKSATGNSQNMVNVEDNDQQYIVNIETNALLDPENKIPTEVLQQLKLMKRAAQENALLHLENSTLQLYEYAIKKMLRKYFPITDMLDLIDQHKEIVDMLQKNKLDYKISRFKILFSALNHYMRFFENSDEKKEAIKNYKTLLPFTR